MKSFNPKQEGFSLLELMIVVAIIGILASIALPGYQNYVRKTRITEATTVLSEARVEMEQFYQDNRTYSAGPCATVSNTDTFTLSCVAGTDTYDITATGTGNLAGYTYAIDEADVRSSTTPNGGTKSCWAIKISGAC